MSLTAEQLQARSRGIGGSDAAVALGLSPWKSALELFHEKRAPAGSVENVPTEPMRWGTLLEPVIRQEYSNRTGRVVRVPETTLVHPAHAFMLANVDGVTTDGRLLEVKTSRTAQGWGEPATDSIPQFYLLQVQHYLAVTALPVADVAVLIGGSEFRQYEVPADLELQALLIDGEREFWSKVEAGTPPEIDLDSPRALEIIRKMYPGTDGRRLTADTMLEHWRAVYDDATIRVQFYEDAVNSAKAHLLYAMGEASELRFADGKALRRKLQTRKGYTVPESTYVDARFVAVKE